MMMSLILCGGVGRVLYLVSVHANRAYEFGAVGIVSGAISCCEVFCDVGIPWAVEISVKSLPLLNPYPLLGWIIGEKAATRVVVRRLPWAVVP